METAERLLHLLGLLQRRADWSAADLAEHLGVTTRTVRRDVTRLRGYGYPVEATAGRGGGYRFGAGATLPPLMLDDREALAVTIGARLASQSAITGLEDASVTALGKLEQLLPARLRPRLEHLDAVAFGDAQPHRPIDRRSFSLLARAAATRVTARFRYVDHHEATTKRHVEAVRIVHARGSWYIVAFDLDRAAWRTFRVDRISDVDVTGQRFADRSGPDPVRLVRRSVPPSNYLHQSTIELEIDAETARSRIAASIGHIEAIDDHCCRVEIGTDDLDWLAGFLLALPWPFTAHEPEQLRTILRQRGRDVAHRHRGAVRVD